MTPADYYRILDLTPAASLNEIKQAYRQKARLYHPDISKDPATQELFISATEAYDFLISYRKAGSQAFTDWQKQSERARRKAHTYARGSYSAFKNSNLYKTTRILNGATVAFGFAISLIIISSTIIGYFYRLRHPIPEMEKPSITVFIMLLIVGVVFLGVSLTFLADHIKSSAKRKNTA